MASTMKARGCGLVLAGGLHASTSGRAHSRTHHLHIPVAGGGESASSRRDCKNKRSERYTQEYCLAVDFVSVTVVSAIFFSSSSPIPALRFLTVFVLARY